MALDIRNGFWGRSFIATAGEIMPPAVCDRDGPAKLKGWLGALKDVPKEQGFAGALGFWRTELGISIPDWAADVFGLTAKPRADGVVEIIGMTWYIRFTLAFVYWFAWIADQAASLFIPAGCTAAKTLPLAVAKGIYDFATHYIGGANVANERAFQAAWNYVCPNQWPDPFTCVTGYLHGTLDKDEASGWTQVSGWCDYYFELSVDAQKWRPDIGTVCNWFYRGCIVSEPEAMRALRAQGVLEDANQRQILECNRPLVGVQESLEWMYVLTADKVGKELAYTETDAIADIKKHGYTDIQARRYVEASHAVLGLRQALMPYYESRISESYLRQILKMNRMRDEDISTLLPFFNYERNKRFAAEIGAPGPAKLVADHAAGYIPSDVFMSEMRVLGAADATISGAIQETNATAQRDIREAGVKAVRSSYMAGELNEVGLIEALQRFEVSGTAATNLAQTWTIERSIRNKPASVGELCSWYANSLITTEEYAYRLMVLGRTDADARRIIKMCADKDMLKRERQAANAEKQRVADEAKRQAAATKAETAEAKAAAAQRKADLAAKGKDERGRFAAIKQDIGVARHVGGSVKTREDEVDKGKLQAKPGPDKSQIQGAQ